MNERMVEIIKRKMAEKNTEELLKIWRDNDRKQWSQEAIEATRRILMDRGENLPAQARKSPEPFIPKWAILGTIFVVTTIISFARSTPYVSWGDLVGSLAFGAGVTAFFYPIVKWWQENRT